MDDFTDVPEWPQWALDRHRAKVLRPADAVQEIRYENGRNPVTAVPGSTVYRAEYLLMPQSDVRRLTDPSNESNVINRVLDDLNLALEQPRELPDEFEDLPFPVRIVPLAAERRRQKAVVSLPVVDAWPVLQRLREEAAEGGRIRESDDVRAVDRTSLEHLFVGTVLSGVPTYSPNGPHAGVGGEQYSGFSPYGRLPVAVPLVAPTRNAPPKGHRRPVVAVLDTGVAPHDWLGPAGADAVVRTLTVGEDVVKSRHPWQPSSVLTSAEDAPVTTDTVSNDINPAYGHGTFIAGVIHQHAPDAEVLMVRVLRSDNVAYEGDVLLGLKVLPEDVDIVCLSLGYYSESVNAALYTSELTRTIEELVKKGVQVVASAGNDATTRPFFPAALSLKDKLVTAVGALNPNGTRAWFTNQGDYVTEWAPGACVISTYPKVSGSGGVTRTVRGSDFTRETVDPDDYSNGFAMWSGTSFAAPLVAAQLANKLKFPKK